MTTVVYLWKETRYNTGHVSIETERKYLSFHPQDTAPTSILYSPTGTLSREFDEDAKTYYNSYESISINSIIDAHVDEYIEKYVVGKYTTPLKSKQGYSIFTNNCSDIVAHSLLYGYSKIQGTSIGQDIAIQLKKYFHGITLHKNSAVHSDIMKTLETIVSLRVGITKKLPAPDLFLKIFGILHLTVWTPSEVFELAETIRDEIG